MKGFIRNIDPLGRLVIPAELRQSYHIGVGDPLRFFCTPGGIVLEPLNASCGICGSTTDLLLVDGIAICREHAEELARVLEKSQSGSSATGGGGTDAAR